METPFASFVVHAPVSVAHHEVPHCASRPQVLLQAPVLTLQKGPACTGLALPQPFAPVPSSAHKPQAPDARANGADDDGQAWVAVVLPKSPFAPVHVPTAALQVGVVPLHALVFVAEQATHAPLAAQMGIAVDGHAAAPPVPLSPVQATQRFVVALKTGVVVVPNGGASQSAGALGDQMSVLLLWPIVFDPETASARPSFKRTMAS